MIGRSNVHHSAVLKPQVAKQPDKTTEEKVKAKGKKNGSRQR